MTRRKEKWCVPGYRVSQRGRFSLSVALTPQFKNAVAMHLGQAFRSSLARPSRNECPFAGELGCGLRFEIGTVDLDPKLFWSPLDFPSPQRRTPMGAVRLPTVLESQRHGPVDGPSHRSHRGDACPRHPSLGGDGEIR